MAQKSQQSKPKSNYSQLLDTIQEIAEKYKFISTNVHKNDNQRMIRYRKRIKSYVKPIQINIYFTTMTVVICIPNHKQIVIRQITIKEMESLFASNAYQKEGYTK